MPRVVADTKAASQAKVVTEARAHTHLVTRVLAAVTLLAARLACAFT